MDAQTVTRTGQSTSGGRHTRVLIAEDDDSLRMLMRIAVDVGGLDIAEASDGITALQLARENPPDLVLLDWMMQGLSGLERAGRSARTRRPPAR